MLKRAEFLKALCLATIGDLGDHPNQEAKLRAVNFGLDSTITGETGASNPMVKAIIWFTMPKEARRELNDRLVEEEAWDFYVDVVAPTQD